MTNWMEIIGVISALVGFLVAIPTISLALKCLRRRVLYMRSVPDPQEQLIIAVRALLGEKESLIEQYGCPPAMQARFEEQERRFENIMQHHSKPIMNPIGVAWKRIKWSFCDDTSTSTLQSIKESLSTLITNWKNVDRQSDPQTRTEERRHSSSVSLAADVHSGDGPREGRFFSSTVSQSS